MEIEINEQIAIFEASLNEKFNLGFQDIRTKYVETARNRSNALLKQERRSTKKEVKKKCLMDLKKALQPLKNSTGRIREYLSGSEVGLGNKKHTGEITSKLPEDLLLSIDRCSQIFTSIYNNAFNPDDSASQKAEIMRLCGPAVEILYRREIRINTANVMGSIQQEVSDRLSQINVARDYIETDPDSQRSQSIDDAFERNRARREEIKVEDYRKFSSKHNSECLEPTAYSTLPELAKHELDEFLIDVYHGQGGRNGRDELKRRHEDQNKLVMDFENYVIQNTDFAKRFYDQFLDAQEAAKTACTISKGEILALHQNHIKEVEVSFGALQSSAMDKLSEVFSNRNARTIDDIRGTNLFQDIECLKNSLITTTSEEWRETQASLVKGLQRDASLDDQQEPSSVIKEITSRGDAFLDKIPNTVDGWISERFSEIPKVLLFHYEEAVVEYERAFTELSNSLDKDAILTIIERKATTETDARDASIEEYVQGRVKHLGCKLIFLYRDILLEVVIPQWRTFGILTKAELLYYSLKFDLQRAKDCGVTTDCLSNNRQRLSAMSELVSLGCAARVIDNLGETIFFADDLLEHLDDMSLRKMGDGNTRTSSSENPRKESKTAPDVGRHH